jgi:4-amino-4-deoxy-L-arabinose transferase-like glycosyltransferase
MGARVRRWFDAFGVQIGAVALAGFIWRIAYGYFFRKHLLPLYGDAYYYTGGANLLANGKGFIEPYHVFGQEIRPSASHPPLYELWLAILPWIKQGWVSQWPHMVWSCVLGAGTVVVTGFAGREVAGRRAGLIAAVLAAIYPNVWVQDGTLESETMAIFTVALVLLLAYRFVRSPSWWRMAWLGVACGLAALARSELILTVPLVMVPLALLVRDADWTRRLGLAALGGLAAVIVIAPWVGYNLTRFHERVTLSTNFGGTIAAANCRETYYGPQIGFKNYDCANRILARVVTKDMDESQQDVAVRRETMRYIRAHRRRVPVVVAARWGRILGMFRPYDDVVADQVFLEREHWASAADVMSWYFVAGVAIGGAMLLRRRREVPLFPLLAMPVIVLVSVGATFAQTRYRAPAEIAFVILAAVALDAIWSRRAKMSPSRGL